MKFTRFQFDLKGFYVIEHNNNYLIKRKLFYQHKTFY